MVIRHWLHFYADWGLDSASFLNNCCMNLPCMNLHWSWRLYDHFYFECSLCHALMSKICISKQNVLTLQHLCLTLFIFFFFSTLLHFSILDLKMNKYCELQAQTENTNWKPTALFIWCYKSQFLYFMWFYFFSTHLSNIIEVLRRHIVCILFWPCFLPNSDSLQEYTAWHDGSQTAQLSASVGFCCVADSWGRCWGALTLNCLNEGKILLAVEVECTAAHWVAVYLQRGEEEKCSSERRIPITGRSL